ncbi:MAG TPA: aldolase/citrate lyase family protein [Candidatus Binataceae bacterium]|nr:aldolase/citrate lyase family protein [Candidatus Binataceae bacterium]
MRENPVRKKWASGQAALGGWLGVPSSFSAEILAHAGFDWLCVDMQHGLIDYPQMVSMLQGMAATDVTPLVRVPWNEPGIIGKSLDAGALGVIIPMVNSPEEAEAAVAACRYAPQGRRSFGPLRASTHYGSDYYSQANATVCCIVMIETRQAVARVDEILSVPGIDAVYVGPADLSVTLGLPPGADNPDASFNDALKRIVESCHRHNIVPGIAGNASTAPKRIQQGFRLVEVASDSRLLAAGAAQALEQVRPAAGAASKPAYL